jgi:hypothetical protein
MQEASAAKGSSAATSTRGRAPQAGTHTALGAGPPTKRKIGATGPTAAPGIARAGGTAIAVRSLKKKSKERQRRWPMELDYLLFAVQSCVYTLLYSS